MSELDKIYETGQQAGFDAGMKLTNFAFALSNNYGPFSDKTIKGFTYNRGYRLGLANARVKLFDQTMIPSRNRVWSGR